MTRSVARLRRTLGGLFWLALYICLSLLPLAIVFAYPGHPRRPFWTELSVALGFVALAMMGLQFAVTARFRHVAAPYGIDIILRFHKQISIVAGALVLAHPIILFVTRPDTLNLLNVVTAPWRARFAVAATAALLALIGISLWRRPLHLRYGTWRLAHGLLATAAVAFALAHIELVGWYVDLPWKRALWAATTLAVIGLLIYVRLVVPWLLLRRPWVVDRVVPERGRAWTLFLRPMGHPGLRFAPGQFAWLTLGRSPFVVEDHPFSFSSSAMDHEQIAFTIKVAGDFTRSVGDVAPGTPAYVEGPHGAFSIDRYDGEGYVFVAGGVGITPIMSMLRTLADRRDARRHLLIYGAPSVDDLTFEEDLEAMRERLQLRIVYVLSSPSPDWRGETGRVDVALLDRHLPRERAAHTYFVCGPPQMMDAVESALRRTGVPWQNIYTERFDMV